jgi:hypothetical protein
VDKISFTVVRMQKDMQVVIFTVALLTQKNGTMAQRRRRRRRRRRIGRQIIQINNTIISKLIIIQE